jgi:hypothetical protein
MFGPLLVKKSSAQYDCKTPHWIGLALRLGSEKTILHSVQFVLQRENMYLIELCASKARTEKTLMKEALGLIPNLLS